MKILYHHRIASKDGQYVHIEEIVNALKELGHEIIIVEPSSITDKQFGKSSGTVARLRCFLPGMVHECLEFLYSIYDFLKLCRVIIQARPDFIYERYNLFFPSGIWAKQLFKLPLILEVNAPLYQERDSNDGISLKNFAVWTEGYVWRSADLVLPVTQALAEIIKTRNVDENKIVVIPNGINRDGRFNKKTQSDTIKDKYQLHDKLVLGFTGFVRTWHRLDKVLDVIGRHKDDNWHFLLVGDGPVRAELEKQAKTLGIENRVTFSGLVNRQEMPDYVAAFDIALQPDVVPYASPLKLFEYMGFGKAILAPDRNNIKEILTDEEDCLLFSVDKEDDFIEKLETLAGSKDLQNKLGMGAINTVNDKGLYWQENANKIVQLYSRLQHK